MTATVVKKGLGIPVGPRDSERLKRYECEFVPQLREIGWLGAIELKTDNIGREQEWMQPALAFCERTGSSLQWHAKDNEQFSSRLGRGLTADEAIEYLRKVEWLVREHDCRIVMHLGTHDWPNVNGGPTPEPIWPPLDERRFWSPIGAEEYLEQLNAHIPVVKAIADYFGPENILAENTHICLTGIAQYNAMQCGTPLFVAYLAEKTGIGTVLDIEHYRELVWLLERKGIAGQFPDYPIVSLKEAQQRVVDMTGIEVKKGQVPSVWAEFLRDFGDVVVRMMPQSFHIGGTLDSLDENGVLNAHLPIANKSQAERVGLPQVIRYINEHGGNMIVEANGANYWRNADYACSPRIADDEEAKWVTLRTTLELIRTS